MSFLAYCPCETPKALASLRVNLFRPEEPTPTSSLQKVDHRLNRRLLTIIYLSLLLANDSN